MGSFALPDVATRAAAKAGSLLEMTVCDESTRTP